ncbi:MAG: hypothetical protein KGQ41_03435 [Alphaproteobacteria bacterium]|nr:hypothetical protein [Alphaproteobacteria bacterium]
MATPQDEALARTENLLRDAEEALQQERLREFWKQWGTTLVGMAVMLVVGTGAGVAWREWQKAKNEKATAALFKTVTAPAIIIGPEVEREMGSNHAAIAYIAKAGSIIKNSKDALPKAELEKLYAAAARADDDTNWGWLARWNQLRLKMDDDKADAKALLKDYENLASERKGQSISALVLTDAAIIAGERLKDPAAALKYIADAEAVVPPTTPTASILSDLKHLYTVRAQSTKEEAAQ